MEAFLLSMILCITQMMKYPPFVDGLDKDVARHILQSNLVVFIKVRDHFQNNPVLLLHWPGCLYPWRDILHREMPLCWTAP